MTTIVYAPGTEETDPKKQNIAIQQAAAAATTNAASIAALQSAGYVVGPGSATNNGFVVYDGTTGKLVKDHAATIALASEVSGNLPVANLNSGTSAGATTFWRGDGAWTVPVLSSLTNSLGADINLNNAANFFDGPSVAQGSTGTWFVSGGVTINDANTAVIVAKLWDGTTVIDSRETVVLTTQTVGSISLSGFLASPAGNLRISVKSSSTTSKMVFNVTGLSKDCTVTAFRLA